jgi:transposase
MQMQGADFARLLIRATKWFAGSDAGGRRAAAIYSMIESAKLNHLNPQRYLADLLTRIADHPARRIAELLPWNWQPLDATRAAA